MAHSFLQRVEARREAKYIKRVKLISSFLRGWRNQASRRKLVVAFELSGALLLISGIGLMASLADAIPSWFGYLWFAATLLMMVLWTCLNITVDMIDSAPLTLLDEYQREQIQNLRALTYLCYTRLGLAFFLALIPVGTYVMNVQPEWGSFIPYGFGIFGIVTYIFVSTLPTVAYAWNLRDD